MTYHEYYKCNNFLKIAKLADEISEDFPNEKFSENDYDFDWFLRFFESVGAISNEDMQSLWAKILNGEVQNPGTFSFRSLETMKNLSMLEAKTFESVSLIVLDISIVISILGVIGQEINEKNSFNNASIRMLEECGLLNGLITKTQLKINSQESGGLELDGYILLIKNISKKKVVLDYWFYNLTKVGLELLPVVYNKDINNTYLIDMGKAIANKYNTLYVSIHPIKKVDDDKVLYDTNINLLKI